MLTSEGSATSVCGICALAISNYIHGDYRKTFPEGSQAEEHRIAAVEYRKAVSAKRGKRGGKA